MLCLKCDLLSATGVLGSYEFDQLVKKLREKKFSVIVDKPTDISTKKHLVIVARHEDDGAVKDEFLALLEVGELYF